MQISAIQCNKCGDTIYSRARHDFRWCSCKSIAIDGGFDYTKVTGNPGDIKHTKLDIKVDKKVLYNDWNDLTDKYGLISGNKPTKKQRKVKKK